MIIMQIFLTLTNEKPEKFGLENLLDSENDDDKEEEIMDDVIFPARKAENELKNYLSMPKVLLNQVPFIWWKSLEASFPSFKILGKKFLKRVF